MRQLATAHPHLAELKELGRSIEGRTIWALRIGERRGNSKKVLFMGCHHAREWIAVEVPFLLARELLEKANEPKIAGWLSSAEIWVAPMVNPDGHEFCRTQYRLGARIAGGIPMAPSVSTPTETTGICGAP
jgi:carboxypeptidase T